MFLKKRQREDPEVGGAGMADIAFLLLIFFLLVTTIDVDTGIGLVLPPAPEDNSPPPPIKDKNMLKILVNGQGSVLIEEDLTPMSQVKKKVMNFIDNNGKDPSLSDSPKKAIVSIKTDRQTPYRFYIDMLDKVMGAYVQLRNDASQKQFGKPYSSLPDGSKQQQAIKDLYPKHISVAEPNK